jgi:GrpB-like predicted nucleotidyltransferase (UPF0157 family)
VSRSREPELSAYSPMWPAVFDIERARLQAIFGADAALIEHIGSTAVPGLGARPIIDIMLGVPALAIVERAMPRLASEGYRHVPELERATPQRRYFVKPDGQPGHFHLHAVVVDTPFWRDHLAFRDALRADPALAAQYSKLKQRLAARHPNDREAYSEGKGAFIREALARRARQPLPAPPA